MKRQWLAAMMGLAAVGLVAGMALAELTDGQKQAAEALIRQFSAKEFDARQQAVERLIELGTDVVPLIQKTLKETKDNEVKTRCEMVLAGIEKKYGVEIIREGEKKETPAVKPIDEKTLEVSKVTIDVTAATLAEVMDAFAQQSGNRRINVPGNLGDKPVTLKVKDMPYWQALDEVCAKNNLMYTFDWQNGGLQLMETEDATDVSGYPGPAVIKVDRGTRSKTFRQPKMGGGPVVMGWGGGMGLWYQLSYYWEDRLPVLSTQVTFNSAVTPDGKELLPPDNRMATPMYYGMGGRPGIVVCWGNTNLMIPSYPDDLKMLKEVKGNLKMEFGIGQKTLKVKDALGEGERSGEADGVSVAIRNMNRQRGFTQMTVGLTRDGKPVQAVSSQDGKYGFVLVDPNGGRHASLGGAYSGRFVANVGGNPQAVVRVGDRAAPDAESVGLMFQQLPDVAGEWTLEYVYPEQQISRDCPFTIKDVPLP